MGLVSKLRGLLWGWGRRARACQGVRLLLEPLQNGPLPTRLLNPATWADGTVPVPLSLLPVKSLTVPVPPCWFSRHQSSAFGHRRKVQLLVEFEQLANLF